MSLDHRAHRQVAIAVPERGRPRHAYRLVLHFRGHVPAGQSARGPHLALSFEDWLPQGLEASRADCFSSSRLWSTRSNVAAQHPPRAADEGAWCSQSTRW